jgi:2'-5' RNA ligase
MPPNWFIGFPVAATPWLSALEPMPRGARLFVPEDVHLTLVFLGPVGRDAAMRAWEEAVGLERRSWSMSPGALAPFGNPRRPSAWSVEPSPRLETLEAFMAAHRERLFDAAGVAEAGRDRRPPRPHATLARPKRSAGPVEHAALRAWAERQRVAAVPVVIGRLALYTWAEHRSSEARRGHQARARQADRAEPGESHERLFQVVAEQS